MSLTKVTSTMMNGQFLNAQDFGATGDGVTDDTAALNAAYAAAGAAQVGLYINSGTYLFTSQLVWNLGIGVRGEPELTTLLKRGNFDGVKITTSAVYDGFRINGDTGNGGSGLLVQDTSYNTIQNLFLFNHAGAGLLFRTTGATAGSFQNRFRNIISTTNGTDGVKIDDSVGGAQNINSFENISCVSNTGMGFKQQGNANNGYMYGQNINCEQNAGGGMLLEGIGSCFVNLYLESNTGFDLKLSDTSIRNFIQLNSSTITYEDYGANNVIIDVGLSSSFNVGNTFRRSPRINNAAGRELNISAGAGGPGPGQSGGALSLLGGGAGGTNGGGGVVNINGGEKTGSGSRGSILMQTGDDGTIIVGGVNGLVSGGVSCSFDMVSTTRVPCFPRLTTVQKNALTGTNGMMLYDSTLNKMQIFEAGAWVSIV